MLTKVFSPLVPTVLYIDGKASVSFCWYNRAAGIIFALARQARCFVRMRLSMFVKGVLGHAPP